VVTKKDKYLAAAQKFLEKGSLDKALAEFMRAVQEDPKDTRTWLRIAEIQVKRGDNEKATEVYLRTADLYVEQGFFQRAVAVYKNIIKLSPSFVEAYLKLADIYKQLGLLSDAVQQFEFAAGVYTRAGKTKEAMASMRQIVDLNPDQPVSRIKLAEAASQAGLVDEAVTEFGKAGDLLRAQGRTDEYLRVAERLLFHKPENVALSKQVAQLYIERNNARFALAKLQACFKVDPRDTETLDLLARAFEQLGQVPKTISVLKELAKVYSDSGRTSDRVATFKRILAFDAADADANAVLSMRGSFVPEAPRLQRPAPPPERPRAPPGSANITFSEMAVPQYLQKEEVSAPLDFGLPPTSQGPQSGLDRADLTPGSPAAVALPGSQVERIIAEADVFVKYGLLDRAADHLRKVFEVEPTHVATRERLAAVLMQLGRRAEAVTELEVVAEQLALSQPTVAADYARRALETDPGSRRARKVLTTLEAVRSSASPSVERGRAPPDAGGDDDFEELSITHDVVEMDTPEPELGSETGDPNAFDDAGEPGTVMRPGLFAEEMHGDTPSEPMAVPVFDESADALPSPAATDPAMQQLFRGISAHTRDLESMTSHVEDDLEGETQENHPARPDDFRAVPRTGPDDGRHQSLLSDLEQVDFFLEQGLAEDARSSLEDMLLNYPPSPFIVDRQARLAALEQAQSPGAVPTANFGSPTSRPYESGTVSPKAMVAAGGEMDLASRRDLGIGYKDMGLHDAAIGEFAHLAEDPAQEVFALSMIGECHEAKGAFADAMAFYKKALNRPAISEAEATQLYYQLGNVFQTMGETNEALYFFEKVLKRDAGFRDVRRRIAELRGQAGGGGGPATGALQGGKNRR
jgi:tetratricopeptide (TPR) repeat protein